MSLLDRLPSTLPRRARLDTYERELKLDARGAQVLENFEASLQQQLISDALFERFYTRLIAIIPDRTANCDENAIARELDDPEPFYCRGRSYV